MPRIIPISAASRPLPRTIPEAVDQLARTLAQAEKEEIASMAEGDLIDLHFGLGMRIRREQDLRKSGFSSLPQRGKGCD